MKKTIFAALCCMVLSLGSAMAQDEMPQTQGGPRGGRGMRGRAEIQLADTAITNHMDLTPDQQNAITALNAAYMEKVEAGMSNRDENGKKLSKEERKARQEQMKSMRQEGRKQLREVLGTELYIQYLEEAADRMPMMGGMRGMGPQGGTNGQGGQRGQRGQRGGGFGGGDDFGGGFGGEF